MTLPVVMGIDPGVSTGVALAFQNNAADTYQFTTYTAKTPEEVWGSIHPAVSVLIVEQFNAQLIDKYGIHTVEVVGGVIALAWRHGVTVIRDTPQQRRPYLAYARAHVPPRKDITVHEQRHEIDALSHVIRYLYHEKHITTLEVL